MNRVVRRVIKIIFRLLPLACLVTANSISAELRHTFAGASAEDLRQPHDLILSPDGTRLYVADNGNDRIAVLDPESLSLILAFGEGLLSQPHDVAFDDQGRLLVADTGNSRIAVFSLTPMGGVLADSIEDGIRRPEGVAFAPDGRLLATGAASNNLVVYQNGQLRLEAGELSSPHDVAIGPNGGIWVADAANDRLVKFNSNLEIDTVLTGEPYEFSGPRYLDFDRSGRMYVADKYNHQIKVIDQNGKLLTVLGAHRAGKGDGLFDRPEGVAIRDQNIWISDTYNDRIVRYRAIDRP